MKYHVQEQPLFILTIPIKTGLRGTNFLGQFLKIECLESNSVNYNNHMFDNVPAQG